MKAWLSIICICGRGPVRDETKKDRVGYCINPVCERYNVRFMWPEVEIKQWWPDRNRGGKGD